MTRREFIDAALVAAREAVSHGAPIVPEIVAAQAALESIYGHSRLAEQANNLFGIKAGSSWAGPTMELMTHEWDDEVGTLVPTMAKWRLYRDWAECFTDYGHILATKRWYADAVEAAKRHDAIGFLEGLLPDAHGPGRADDEPGWATDPRYYDKVLNVAREHALIP